MKSKFLSAAFAVVSACALMACGPEKEQTTSNAQQTAAAPAAQPAEPAKDNNMNKLTLTAEWDKVFPKSEKVEHSKVTFKNHFGIELAAEIVVVLWSCAMSARGRNERKTEIHVPDAVAWVAFGVWPVCDGPLLAGAPEPCGIL